MLFLDDRDLAILTALSREGRLSKAELARRINLTPTPCWERLKRLEKAGIVTGYHADISLKKIAPHVTVFVTIELENHAAATFQSFERMVGRESEITQCWALGGGFDYLIQVIARDIERYQQLMEKLMERGAGFSRYYTYIVTKAVKSASPPPFASLLSHDGSSLQNPGTK